MLLIVFKSVLPASETESNIDVNSEKNSEIKHKIMIENGVDETSSTGI